LVIKSRKRKSIIFIFSNNNINLRLLILSILRASVLFNSVDRNVIIGIVGGKNVVNAQLESSSANHPVTLHGNIFVS
jgi:hypothetical protein